MMVELIRQRLMMIPRLDLALHNNEPAIFNQKAVSDPPYPHLVLTADKYSDPQKGLAGQLTCDILTTQMIATADAIEPLIRRNLEGVFFNGEEIFNLKWRQSDAFAEPAAEKIPLVYGTTMLFDVYEYPSAATSTPDPVTALNNWAAWFDSDLMIIGRSPFPENYTPTRQRPVVYFDVDRLQLTDQKATAVFADAWINVHLFAPTLRSRREWLMALWEALMLSGEVRLEDDSPLRLLEAQFDWSRSETEGQLQLKFNYGIRRRHYAHTLRRENIKVIEKRRKKDGRNLSAGRT